MNTEDTYNRIADHFSQTRSHPWQEFSLYTTYIQPGQQVLDIGCGNGRLYHSLPQPITYTGIDISEQLLTHARTQIPQGTFVQGSMTTLPFTTESFDTVCAVASFQHLATTAERIQTLQEITRVLIPGGIVILSNWDIAYSKHKKTLQKTIQLWIQSKGKYKKNDYLIPWKSAQGETIAMRYYHHVTRKEIQQLTKALPLSIKEYLHIPVSKHNRNLCIILQKQYTS